MRPGPLAWFGFAWALLLSSIAIVMQRPPAALPIDAPGTSFSAARAIRHVDDIARAPHPMGSPEAEYVRATLMHKLQKLGLAPEMQTPASVASHRPVASNIVARKNGTGPRDKKAILLSAHYDSVAAGPGAGDNASGVACILETLRALNESPPLERDLIILFDDGEETGFDGSLLFIDEHPWAKQVGLVLNLDARGNSGPSVMFETSEQNGWLIRQYAAAARQPFATSFTMDVYQLLPNDTDLTIYKRAGLPGLNFAFVGGLACYHTARDTAANLSLNTLQHQGENTLACSRHFGQLDLNASDTVQENVIYSSIFSRFILIYPISWAIPLSSVAVLLFVAVVILGARTDRAPSADVAVGAGLFSMVAFAALFVGCVMLFMNDKAAALLHLGPGGRPPWLAFDVPILSLISLLLAALTLLLVRWSAYQRSLQSLSLGALSIWVLLSLATALGLPGGSYLFVWPTLGGLVAVAVSLAAGPKSLLPTIAPVVGSIPTLVLIPPLITSLFDGLSLRLCAPTLVIVVLFVGSILPLLRPLLVAPPIGPRVPGQPHSKPPDAWISSELGK